jgi:hypothetical protein
MQSLSFCYRDTCAPAKPDPVVVVVKPDPVAVVAQPVAVTAKPAAPKSTTVTGLQDLAFCYRDSCLPKPEPVVVIVAEPVSAQTAPVLSNMSFCYQSSCSGSSGSGSDAPPKKPHRNVAVAALLNQAGVDVGFGPAHVGVNWNQLMNQRVGIDVGFGPAHVGVNF